jgi:hypothetical protein
LFAFNYNYEPREDALEEEIHARTKETISTEEP